jgi:hypothetical protein
MNELEFSRSINEILTNRLTKEKATDQFASNTFDHPNRNESEIHRAVRLAVFGKLAGLQSHLVNIHRVNRLFAYWIIFAGLQSKKSPWDTLKSNALDGLSALFSDQPELQATIEQVKEELR